MVSTITIHKWLVKKGIIMVSVEPPSLNSAFYIKVHKAFLENGVAIVEGLTNLESLPDSQIFFVGAPIGLANGDGFPIRTLAIEF
jgi:arylformamidase